QDKPASRRSGARRGVGSKPIVSHLNVVGASELKSVTNWRDKSPHLAMLDMQTRVSSPTATVATVPLDRKVIIGFSRGPLLFHSFDADYLDRLASGDSAIERHFSLYFGDLLSLKLRVRIRSAQLIEDIRQETLLRVLQIVRT